MATPDHAATAARVSTRLIFKWVEADSVHFVETQAPSPLVCLRSLPGMSGRGAVEDWQTA